MQTRRPRGGEGSVQVPLTREVLSIDAASKGMSTLPNVGGVDLPVPRAMPRGPVNFGAILFLAVGLAMDAAAVSIAQGVLAKLAK